MTPILRPALRPCKCCGLLAVLDRCGFCPLCQHECTQGHATIRWEHANLTALARALTRKEVRP